MYDFIHIGGGIACLYSAYKLLEQNPELSILVLERDNHIGGRVWKEKFCTTNVVVGAGILRAKKDIIPIMLLQDLDIKYTVNKHKADYIVPFNTNIKPIFEKLKKEYKKDPEKYISYNFKQFAESILGKKQYNEYKIVSGYSDYDKQNVHDTLYCYNMDDNYFNSDIISVDWIVLMTKLKDKLNQYKNFNLVTNINVTNIDYNDTITVFTNKKTYQCKKLISGTDITSFLKIFKNLPFNILKPYNLVKGNPFLLLYAKFSKESALIIEKYIKTFTVCTGILQKIIPINPKDGIYLVGYSDNKCALALKPYVKNKSFISNLVKKTLGIKEDIVIQATKHYFWENGTHYFKPFLHSYTKKEFYNKITNPIKNLYIIGEMVAEKQGWIGGALETVDKVISKIK